MRAMKYNCNDGHFKKKTLYEQMILWYTDTNAKGARTPVSPGKNIKDGGVNVR